MQTSTSHEVGGLASVTGTTIFGENEFTYYYFYYNWTMSSLNPCLSERVEFTVDVQGVDGSRSCRRSTPHVW